MKTASFNTLRRSASAARSFRKALTALLAGFSIAMSIENAACHAAVVNGLMVTTVDAPLRYDANGPVNTSNAWSNNPPADVDGPWYAVPGLAPAPIGGANWNFLVRHTAKFKSNQATDARLWVQGNHIQVPIPKHGEALNALPEIGTDAITIPVNRSANVSTWAGLEHVGQSPPHYDVYGVIGTKMKYTVLGAAGTLGGKVEVLARHSESIPKEFLNWRIDSTLVSSSMQYRPGGSTVSFDATTNMLTFNPGTVDVLDMQGGLSHGVDPRFATDPLLGAGLSVSPLFLQGMEADGRFRFSGGVVNVMGQTPQTGMRASFNEYIVGDTSEQMTVDSFGVLHSGNTFEVPTIETTAPTFLQTFAEDHLLQHIPTPGNFSDRALTFAFATAPGVNLAQLTNGFTMSVMSVPADIIIGGTGYNAPGEHVGDYNGDGLVDSLDYHAWRADFGNLQSFADGNGNGVTDAADYVLWRANSGDVLSTSHLGQLSATSIAVPEPTFATLAVIGLCITLAGRRTSSNALSNRVRCLGQSRRA